MLNQYEPEIEADSFCEVLLALLMKRVEDEEKEEER